MFDFSVWISSHVPTLSIQSRTDVLFHRDSHCFCYNLYSYTLVYLLWDMVHIGTHYETHTKILQFAFRTVFYRAIHCKKRTGCFNLWIVTLVADKLRRLWLWEVYAGIANCISNLSPNLTLQQPEHLWGSHYNYTSKMLIKAGDSHRCSVVTISARSWLLLHAFWYKPVWHLPQWLLTARSWL